MGLAALATLAFFAAGVLVLALVPPSPPDGAAKRNAMLWDKRREGT